MERKNLIIISVLLIIIFVLCVGIFSVSTHVEYEKIEVVPNGTSMEIPTNNLTFNSDVPNKGFKIWTFEQGGVVSFNPKEVKANYYGTNHYSEKGLDELNKVIKTILNNYEKKDHIDGYIVYTTNAKSLGNYDGRTMYVIMGENKETGDNIIIMTDNKDITLNIAKSINYKNGDIKTKQNTGKWVEVNLNDYREPYKSVNDIINEDQAKKKNNN